MHKSTFPAAIAICAALSFPAHAAKFNCVFYGTGIPATPACTIDSADPSKKCEKAYAGSVTGTCSGGNNLIRCIFHTDPLPANFQNDIAVSGPVPLLSAPGLLAGGVVEASTKLFLAGYKENRAAPEFDALCLPQN